MSVSLCLYIFVNKNIDLVITINCGKRKGRLPRMEVVDLFCGIGGLSYGMKCQGFHIMGGFDIDKTCRFAYETNNESNFFFKDIRKVTGKEVSALYSKKSIRVLAGCAPCQPFSSYAHTNKEKDPNKYDLLYEFGRLVKELHPDIVTMENVPSILNFKLKSVFPDFENTLKSEGYMVSYKTVFCPNYGIPQKRKRLVLLASRFGKISLLDDTNTPENYLTVGDTIRDLEPLAAGESSTIDPLHRCRRLTSINLRRVHNTPYGGGWKDWPTELVLDCHKKKSGESFGSVYGRMTWDAPSPTITTECTGLGNGRFGHPEQDRAISIREAALLQTFPKTYKFFENENSISILNASRYIGNAVPPKLGEVIAKSIKKHIRDNK